MKSQNNSFLGVENRKQTTDKVKTKERRINDSEDFISDGYVPFPNYNNPDLVFRIFNFLGEKKLSGTQQFCLNSNSKWRETKITC